NERQLNNKLAASWNGQAVKRRRCSRWHGVRIGGRGEACPRAIHLSGGFENAGAGPFNNCTRAAHEADGQRVGEEFGFGRADEEIVEPVNAACAAGPDRSVAVVGVGAPSEGGEIEVGLQCTVHVDAEAAMGLIEMNGESMP